jgi:hypothetical protein
MSLAAVAKWLYAGVRLYRHPLMLGKVPAMKRWLA